MVSKITMYPTKVTQPNRNKSSGLQGKCFDAVERNGHTYNISCTDQRDPKYHHEWSNAEEILKGKTIQCGRPSTHMCSHATYYGIKGYRNTCPIAGVTGTYTQPATLRLFFDLSKKKISSSAKIEKVELSFEHRCTGVDVANGKEYTSWGPNFNGFKAYSHIKPLTIKIGSEKKISDKNPPLSSKFNNTGKFTFKNVDYKDLTQNGVDVIYGNNLETNPGNIYIRNLKINIYYTDGTPYLEGSRDKKSLYISDVDTCRTQINFTIEAGYKQGDKKVPLKTAPKNLLNDVKIEKPNNNIIITKKVDSKNQKKAVYTLTDKTNTPGEKEITFYIKGTKKKITYKYTAKKRPKPTITIPTEIERNVKDPKVTGIIAANGCAKSIKAYADAITSTPFFTFTNLDNSKQSNIIPQTQADNFYKKLATELSCKLHTIYFKVDGEEVSKNIKIKPTVHTFEITEPGSSTPILSYETIQNKSSNKTVNVKYIQKKELIKSPKFIIENPTHGQPETANGAPTNQLIETKKWGKYQTNDADIINGSTTSITIGTYYPGDFNIKIKEDVNLESCEGTPFIFKVKILSLHKQYYDEIFVRGEDSTAFEYDYLVALEGDSITKPIYVETFTIESSFDDIKICAKKENVARLTEINYIPISITNTSQNNDIKNLFIELNPIRKDEDNILHASPNEWLESDGIFYNFKENFDKFNTIYNDFITVKNLTNDEDNVDEEDVYIHIPQINHQEQIDIKIPFSCSVEKEIYLQFLLFGQPIDLYEMGNCSSRENIFDKVILNVYDSILTDMKIEGETDLFNLTLDSIQDCPKECFRTSMTYSIKNLDTNTLDSYSKTIIQNDPRLVPYKFKYGTQEKAIDNYNKEDFNGLTFNQGTAIRTSIVNGIKIDAYIQFAEHDEIHLKQYTDYQGEVTFFVNIPNTVGESFTIDKLLEYMSIEYEGGEFYNGYKQKTANTKYVDDGSRPITNYPSKNSINFTVFKNQIEYKPGQVVPLKIKAEGLIKYIQNEIEFYPKIETPGSTDSLTVFYEICGLKDNRGKLKTTFKTTGYHFVPNEVSKTIFCGMDTNLTFYTKLTKVIVENQSINRLHIALENKERDNKDIKLEIKEYMRLEKYDVLDYNIDKGVINVNNNKIVWEIDYIKEDDTIRGYIDFKAKEIGYSDLQTTITDFIDNMNPKPKFGKELYQCECNKG